MAHQHEHGQGHGHGHGPGHEHGHAHRQIHFDLSTSNPLPFSSIALTPPPPPPPLAPSKPSSCPALSQPSPTGPSGKPSKPPAQCPYCGMTFKKLEHCQRHERTHTLARPYECSVCLKTFARQSVPNPLFCPDSCRLTTLVRLSNRDTLNRHLRLHSRPDDGSSSKSKKRPPKTCTLPSSTPDFLPSISTPAILHPQLDPTCSSPYSADPLHARTGRERGFSLSAVDEHSANFDPSYHHPLPVVSRQSISLPPHWSHYPQFLTPSNLFGHHPIWNPIPQPPPPPPSDERSLNASSSPLVPNNSELLSLSPPTPLDSSFLSELSSYSLTDHQHSSNPPMSAPATCTTYGPFPPVLDSWSCPPPSLSNDHGNTACEDWLGLELGRHGTTATADGAGAASHGGRSRSASQPLTFFNPWSLVLLPPPPSPHHHHCEDAHTGWDDR